MSGTILAILSAVLFLEFLIPRMSPRWAAATGSHPFTTIYAVTALVWLLNAGIILWFWTQATASRNQQMELPEEPEYLPPPARPTPEDIEDLILPEKEIPPEPKLRPDSPRPELLPFPPGFRAAAISPMPPPLVLDLIGSWRKQIREAVFPETGLSPFGQSRLRPTKNRLTNAGWPSGLGKN